MRKHLAVIIILISSIAVHFAFFGHPRETVFDEVHFGKFVSGYFTHEYFFDIHPPLGKLIISGAGYLADFKPGFSFGNIGDKFPDGTYRTLRLLPSIAGTLLPVVIVLLLLELNFSRIGAAAAGLFVVFENALLVQSRFMLLDGFLLLFGFTAWWLYARYRNNAKIWYILGASAFAGAAASVKWTGITFLAAIGIIELMTAIRQRSTRRFANLILVAVIPAVLYYAIFAVHFKLLSKPGPGDAFMTTNFREGKLSTFDKFIELNREMYRANARLTATHPYSTKRDCPVSSDTKPIPCRQFAWYTWPLMLRPIYYWNDGGAKIYLIGNPVVWWASTFGILYILLSTTAAKNRFYWLLSGTYLLNLLPFIGIDRAMFLYHYFTALIIAIIALVYFVDNLKNRKRIFAVLLAVSGIAFVFFAPLSYGLNMSEKAFDSRMWIDSWR